MSVVKYHGPTTFPTRDQFIDRDLDKIIISKITKKEPIFFMPNDVFEQTTNVEVDGAHNFTYTPIIIGVLESGRKVSVVVTSVRPFFDIELVKDRSYYEGILRSEGIDFDYTEVVQQKPFFYYTRNTRSYLRIFFTKTNVRVKAIKYLNGVGISTYWDDNTCYYRKVAREIHLNLADWLLLKTYYIPGKTSSIKGSVLYVDVADIISYSGDGIVMEKRTVVEGKTKFTQEVLKPSTPEKDRLMTLAWDIENYSEATEISHKNLNDKLFMIGCCFSWYYENDAFSNICLTTFQDIDPLENTLIVTFTDVKIMIMAFAELIARMSPDYWCGYNDSQYDTPYIHTRLQYYKMGRQFIEMISPIKVDQYNSYKIGYIEDKAIKIEAGKAQLCSFYSIPGIVTFDVMIEYRKATSGLKQWSLRYVLQRNKLGAKYDMPIKTMFRIYRSGTPAEKKDVAYYCMIDALSCHRIVKKRNIIRDKKVIATWAYVSMKDCFMTAGGTKVRNMNFDRAFARGYAAQCNFKDTLEDSKYSGAWVLEPKKGLYHVNNLKKIINIPGAIRGRPVPDLDFKSLYPSEVITYNLSNETVINDEQLAEQLIAEGEDVMKHHVEYAEKDYDFYIIRHQNKKEKMGVLVCALLELMDARDAEKRLMKPWENKLKTLTPGTPEYDATCRESPDYDKNLEEAEFYYEYHNTKQNAIKVLMNSFYGEEGMKNSPLFMIEISNLITNLGRMSLTFAKDFIEIEKGCTIVYGDTDSIYFMLNDCEFEDLDHKFLNGEIDKITYSSTMIERSIAGAQRIEGELNMRLKKDNGTDFLVMQYEKTLFPCMFAMKKHYGGFMHSSKPNMKPLLHPENDELCRDALMIKGFKYDKRQASMFTNKMCFSILTEALSLNSTQSMSKTIKQRIIEIEKMDLSDCKPFIKMINASSKEGSVFTQFIERLKKNKYLFRESPHADGKIEFAYVKKPLLCSYSGGDTADRVIRHMEPAVLLDDDYLQEYPEYREYVRKNALNGEFFEIDIPEYVTRELIGILCQFVLYKRRFANVGDIDVGKREATKYLNNIFERIIKKDKSQLAIVKSNYKELIVDSNKAAQKLKTIMNNNTVKNAMTKIYQEVMNEGMARYERQKDMDKMTTNVLSTLLKEKADNEGDVEVNIIREGGNGNEDGNSTSHIDDLKMYVRSPEYVARYKSLESELNKTKSAFTLGYQLARKQYAYEQLEYQEKMLAGVDHKIEFNMDDSAFGLYVPDSSYSMVDGKPVFNKNYMHELVVRCEELSEAIKEFAMEFNWKKYIEEGMTSSIVDANNGNKTGTQAVKKETKPEVKKDLRMQKMSAKDFM